MARDVGDQHAAGFRIVERAAQRHMQRAVHDHGAQHLDAALVERLGRHMQRVEDRVRSVMSLTAFP